MGIVASQYCCPTTTAASTDYESAKQLRAKVLVLEQKLREIQRLRSGEARAFEKNALLFACKEEEWRDEKKKQKEEMVKLRRTLEEEQDKVRKLEAEGKLKGIGDHNSLQVLEIMKAEKVKREEAAEKWKQLYHAIKIELDDLIHRTKQGELLYLGPDQGIIEGFQRELRAKEEMLADLKSKVAALEKDAIKKDREIDILRQSLRILSNTKRRNCGRKNVRGLRSKVPLNY